MEKEKEYKCLVVWNENYKEKKKYFDNSLDALSFKKRMDFKRILSFIGNWIFWITLAILIRIYFGKF